MATPPPLQLLGPKCQAQSPLASFSHTLHLINLWILLVLLSTYIPNLATFQHFHHSHPRILHCTPGLDYGSSLLTDWLTSNSCPHPTPVFLTSSQSKFFKTLCPIPLWVLSHFSHVWLFATLWTMAHQDPLSMGFSRQENWRGLGCCALLQGGSSWPRDWILYH